MIEVFEVTGFAVLYSLMVVGGGLLILALFAKVLEKALVVSMGIDALCVVAGRVGGEWLRPVHRQPRDRTAQARPDQPADPDRDPDRCHG